MSWPSGPTRTEVFEAFSPSVPRSKMLPARRWTPRSRAQPRAAVRLGPSSGSAPATSSSPPASRFHFSGRATNSAPLAADSRTKRSAAARFRCLSPFEFSCTAATRTRFVLRLIDQSIGWTQYMSARGVEAALEVELARDDPVEYRRRDQRLQP